jgi:Cys-rich protein (TIGR01571 family)
VYAQIVVSAQLSVFGNGQMKFSTSLWIYAAIWICFRFIQGPLDNRIMTALFDEKTAEPGLIKNSWQNQVVNQSTTLLLGIVFAFLLYDLRSKFRKRFNIPGSVCGDFFLGWCCNCCVLAQMDRHLTLNQGRCSCSDPGPHPNLGELDERAMV